MRRPAYIIVSHEAFINGRFKVRSDYCTVDGAEIVPYKVTKYRRAKAFKSVVMVG